MWEIMLEIILDKANILCPFKDMKIREDTPQWITKEILSEINHKDYLYSKAKNSILPTVGIFLEKRKMKSKNS